MCRSSLTTVTEVTTDNITQMTKVVKSLLGGRCLGWFRSIICPFLFAKVRGRLRYGVDT